MPPAFCREPDPYTEHIVLEVSRAVTILRHMKVCVCKDGCEFSELQLNHFRPVQFAPVQPSKFGPALWTLLHCCAKRLPARARDILYALQYLLPCLQCQEHLQNECKLDPDLLKGPHDKIEEQMHELHNRVNRRKERERAKRENREVRDVDEGMDVLSKYRRRCRNFDIVFDVVEQQWHYRCDYEDRNTLEQLVQCLRSKMCYIALCDVVRELLAIVTGHLVI